MAKFSGLKKKKPTAELTNKGITEIQSQQLDMFESTDLQGFPESKVGKILNGQKVETAQKMAENGDIAPKTPPKSNKSKSVKSKKSSKIKLEVEVKAYQEEAEDDSADEKFQQTPKKVKMLIEA